MCDSLEHIVFNYYNITPIFSASPFFFCEPGSGGERGMSTRMFLTHVTQLKYGNVPDPF